MTHKLSSVVAVLLLTTLAGCTVPIKSNPESFSVQGATESLRGQQSIALKNAYDRETKEIISNGSGVKWEADLKQFTDTATSMLGRHMMKNGITIDPQADKSISLRVHEIMATVVPVVVVSMTTATLAVEARLGDGTKIEFHAQNTSPAGGPRAIDGAIVFALTKMLNDERFLAYVNR